jgi:hypothetical protein
VPVHALGELGLRVAPVAALLEDAPVLGPEPLAQAFGPVAVLAPADEQANRHDGDRCNEHPEKNPHVSMVTKLPPLQTP